MCVGINRSPSWKCWFFWTNKELTIVPNITSFYYSSKMWWLKRSNLLGKSNIFNPIKLALNVVCYSVCQHFPGGGAPTPFFLCGYSTPSTSLPVGYHRHLALLHIASEFETIDALSEGVVSGWVTPWCWNPHCTNVTGIAFQYL